MFRDILLLEDVVDFEATERRDGGRVFVRLRGFAFHSALVVKSVDVEVRGSTVTFNADLDRPKNSPAGATGHFDQEIELPPSAEELRFGPGGPIVWTSHGGLVVPETLPVGGLREP